VIEQDLQACFHAVDTNWSDEDVHRRFVTLCAARGELAQAARCYRRVRDTDPTRRESAERHLEAVLAAALATLASAKIGKHSHPWARRSRTFWLVCGVGVGLCGYVILSVLRLLRP
jgi:hypothetical protein